MKYMKLGKNKDTFYTKAATRSVLSDVPTDLIVQINNTRFLLHKFPLLLKCGLLHRLCSDTDDPSQPPTSIELHDIPGSEEAFELCAKFCYGIAINLSANNFVQAITAARFLQMTESVSKGNFIMKLETFFESCIIHGWKDSIVTLKTTGEISGWPDDPWIVQPCMDTIVDKILTHPSKVTWSYTYTRPGYNQKEHRSVPKDWWTEDVSELELDLFRSIISTVRSTKKLPPSLIGEAFHVYACKHLPDPSEMVQNTDRELLNKHRHVLEFIVSMIPGEPGSVSGRFLLRLLKVANQVGPSPSIKADLIRRSGRQLDEALPGDLIFPLPLNPQSHDVDLVEAILENFLVQLRRPLHYQDESQQMVRLIRVATNFDSYLQILAGDVNLPVTKFIELCGSLPEIARQEHDSLYQAIDTYLKEHQEVSKAERKRLCQVINCRKLSADMRFHAIANDRLPLRKIVQVLFIEQEKAGVGGSRAAEDPERGPRRQSTEQAGARGSRAAEDPERGPRRQSTEQAGARGSRAAEDPERGPRRQSTEQTKGPEGDAWVPNVRKLRSHTEIKLKMDRGSGSKTKTKLTQGEAAEDRTK